MKNLDLIQKALSYANAQNYKAVVDVLNKFMLLNTPRQRNRRFYIYNWVAKDSVRLGLTGVYHDADNHVAVATDTHVLVVSKDNYIEEWAGQIIDKNGSPVEHANFPNYKRVIPNITDASEVEVNLETIKNRLRVVKAQFRLKANKRNLRAAINILSREKRFYIEAKYVQLLLTLPSGKFFLTEHRSGPIMFCSDDGKMTALFMSMAISETTAEANPQWCIV